VTTTFPGGIGAQVFLRGRLVVARVGAMLMECRSTNIDITKHGFDMFNPYKNGFDVIKMIKHNRFTLNDTTTK
jgi:hypothetical protein